jgi:hypothetical protein
MPFVAISLVSVSSLFSAFSFPKFSSDSSICLLFSFVRLGHFSIWFTCVGGVHKSGPVYPLFLEGLLAAWKSNDESFQEHL